MLITSQTSLQEEIRHFNLEVVASNAREKLMTLRVQPTLLEKIKEKRTLDEKLQKVRFDIQGGRAEGFSLDLEGVLRFRGRKFVPSDPGIQEEILKEAYQSPYTIHPSGTN